MGIKWLNLEVSSPEPRLLLGRGGRQLLQATAVKDELGKGPDVQDSSSLLATRSLSGVLRLPSARATRGQVPELAMEVEALHWIIKDAPDAARWIQQSHH